MYHSGILHKSVVESSIYYSIVGAHVFSGYLPMYIADKESGKWVIGFPCFLINASVF